MINDIEMNWNEKPAATVAPATVEHFRYKLKNI